MNEITRPLAEGFTDSLVLARAVLAAVIGGAARVAIRLVVEFANHEPLQVGPNDFRRTSASPDEKAPH
ncbi:hypothetical protein [Lysobacter enzymogenes]|uniref:hypothetical protein n=1 Tax=Lysobacter enzymogenes TaxID=69 RepID=UPI001A956952|nr:hypothetical protein [Lysobacter enzymogenes]QQP96515.1 hypothetical protein JHW38_00195 [Lysobacter enzymogenes]